MPRLRTIAIAFAIGVSTVSVLVCGGVGLVSSKAQAALDQRYDVHAGDFPIPFPLSKADIEAALEGVDVDALAMEQAVVRGRRLVEALYPCQICHGDDFGGKVMFDDGAMGTAFAPNLTKGAGGTTAAWTAADFDRKVRHGVDPNGRAGMMPSEDFQRMSDRELSDIIAFLRALPPVDRASAPLALGPIAKVLVGTGKLPLSAARIPQTTVHPVEPPPLEDALEAGAHIAAVCVGCHRATFNGGPIVAGPPDWPSASNLTTLRDWSFADFDASMRRAVRPDGTPLRPPMSDIPALTQHWSEAEMKAVFGWLQGLEEMPTGH